MKKKSENRLSSNLVPFSHLVGVCHVHVKEGSHRRRQQVETRRRPYSSHDQMSSTTKEGSRGRGGDRARPRHEFFRLVGFRNGRENKQKEHICARVQDEYRWCRSGRRLCQTMGEWERDGDNRNRHTHLYTSIPSQASKQGKGMRCPFKPVLPYSLPSFCFFASLSLRTPTCSQISGWMGATIPQPTTHSPRLGPARARSVHTGWLGPAGRVAVGHRRVLPSPLLGGLAD